MYEFKDEFLTGIELIDKEHRRLFEIADELYELKNEEFMPDKYDNIKHILSELRDYTKMHFAHEEEYMESIGYKKIFSQKVQHQELIARVDEWDWEDLDENQNEMIDEILTTITDWLINHILHMDKLIGEV